MPTLRDVAKQAGVSVTTASIVLNGKCEEGRISPETAQRVLHVVEELNYRPNQVARQLRYSSALRRVRIGLYWPMDRRLHILGARLAHMNEVLIEQELDYEIVIQTYQTQNIKDFMGPTVKGRYDGIIVGASSDADINQLEELNLSIPVILLNRESRKYSTVGVSSTLIGMKMAALLQKKGCKQCAVVKTREQFVGASGRTKAFLYACAQLEIETRPEWTFSGTPSIGGGVQATEEYCSLSPQMRPNVIYYEEDSMAIGGQYALQKNGIAVPDDVELIAIGTQQSEMMEYLTPPISCVSLPPNVDRQAMLTMMRLLQENEQNPIHIELEPMVQLRGSFLLQRG